MISNSTLHIDLRLVWTKMLQLIFKELNKETIQPQKYDLVSKISILFIMFQMLNVGAQECL